MATTTLGTPLADDAVRSINFFNGRLLTGGDLSREQAARRLADRRVAQATGPGVAWGLEVSALSGTPVGRIQVTAGLGVSASGLVLNLAGDAVVQLVPPPAEVQAALGSGGFSPCGNLPGATAAAADGLYLLTLAPLSVAEGWAPVLALDDVNKRCSTDAYAEAAQLRLLPISGMNLGGSDEASVARLRNHLAYAYFDAERVAAAHARPGVAPELVPGVTDGRTPCDLPLAVVHMRSNAVVFVDGWAVRRRLAPRPASAAYGDWVGDSATALGEAQMLQFQAHTADTPAVLGAGAQARLDWLPPAGFLPAATTPAAWRSFLGDRAPAMEVPLAAAAAPEVLAGALRGDAVRLAGTAADARFRVYRIGGGNGPVLFVRDSRNMRHAEQIWLDGARAGLPTASDVQAAIDQLRAGTCLHLVLRPGMDLAAAFKSIKGRDVTVCFEPGTYALDRPLLVEKGGHVRVHGPGASLVNTEGQRVLAFLACASVTVSDLRIEGAKPARGDDPWNLPTVATLAVVDTADVVIERVVATCAAGTRAETSTLFVSAIVTDNGVLQPARVTIDSCVLSVGAWQAGIACIGPDAIRIRRNRIDAGGRTALRQLGITLAGAPEALIQIEDNVLHDVAVGITARAGNVSGAEGFGTSGGRIHIERNQIELKLTEISAPDAYGIRVRQVRSATVSGNVIRADPAAAKAAALVALRLEQRLGPQLLVRDNLFLGAPQGIVFAPSETPEYFAWIFQCNVALGERPDVLQYPQALTGRVVDENNKPAGRDVPTAGPK